VDNLEEDTQTADEFRPNELDVKQKSPKLEQASTKEEIMQRMLVVEKLAKKKSDIGESNVGGPVSQIKASSNGNGSNRGVAKVESTFIYDEGKDVYFDVLRKAKYSLIAPLIGQLLSWASKTLAELLDEINELKEFYEKPDDSGEREVVKGIVKGRLEEIGILGK
jgi:hypothetical protein